MSRLVDTIVTNLTVETARAKGLRILARSQERTSASTSGTFSEFYGLTRTRDSVICGKLGAPFQITEHSRPLRGLY